MRELAIDRTNITLSTYIQFQRDSRTYDYIFCDEVQDLPADVIAEMKRRSNTLILAGDPHQSIYDNRVDPQQIPHLANCEDYRLTIIHRLTTL